LDVEKGEKLVHILLIHQAFAALDEPGGTRHIEMARYLAGNSHKVTIITSPVSYLTGKTKSKNNKWKTIEHPFPSIEIVRVYTYSALHRSFFHRVLSFFSFMFSSFFVGLGVKNVDVIWGTSPPIFQGWTAWVLARIKRIPFLFEVRDLWPAFAIAVGVLHQKTLIRLSLWLESFLYRHADTVVVNSPGFIEHVETRGAKVVHLVENGVDPSMFEVSEKGSPFRTKHGLSGKCVILYAGAHGISNDLEVVLGAAALTRSNPNICYVLIGDGKEKPALIRKARELLLENVVFLPPVSKMEMPQIISESNACIAILKPIELYKTTYPNKVFDYMAAGKPVLLAIDGVIREVVEEAQAGIFCSPGDPEALATGVKKMNNDVINAQRMGENGKRYVKAHFNRQDLAGKFESVLLNLTGKSK
jgi:glycosyltransferase involved in cell wall biosynthesis